MPSLPRRRLLAALAGTLAAGCAAAGLPRLSRAAEDGRPLVAAASDLQLALPELAVAFAEASGEAVELAFGSSGNLARQIRQGAPYQLYLSADEDYVLALARDGFTRDEGRLYAEGRLALVVPEGSPLLPDGTLADLAAALEDGRLLRFAIANPEHAPYGRRAEEALRHAGLWPSIRDRLVLGENVSQAAQFAVSGNAQGGLVAHALALSPSLAARSSHALVPAEWHAPLRQRMVLLKQAGPVAERFLEFLGGPTAREILARHGFRLPGAPG